MVRVFLVGSLVAALTLAGCSKEPPQPRVTSHCSLNKKNEESVYHLRYQKSDGNELVEDINYQYEVRILHFDKPMLSQAAIVNYTGTYNGEKFRLLFLNSNGQEYPTVSLILSWNSYSEGLKDYLKEKNLKEFYQAVTKKLEPHLKKRQEDAKSCLATFLSS